MEPITVDGQRDKYIGLALAISSSLAIGTSFIITKKVSSSTAQHGSPELSMATHDSLELTRRC